MIRAMNRAAIATAVRAALADADAFILQTESIRIQESLIDHLNRMAVEIEPTKMVSQDRYDLLELKYKTLLQLLEYSEKVK